MELPDRHIDAFVALVFPDHKAPTRFVARLRDDPEVRARFLVLEDEDGGLLAGTGLDSAGGALWVLYSPASTRPLTADEVGRLISEALDRARALGAVRVTTRLEARELSSAVREGLRAGGLRAVGERFEYAAAVDDLPSDVGTPLRWENLSTVGTDLAAQMLGLCAEGDPEDEEDDPHLVLAAYLDDPVLSNGPETVQVGFLGDEPVAFAFAQVHANGFGRITYMGLLPAQRGRALGGWVHRHGFAMLRQQGAKRYRGGTRADNVPMRRLFERHGCTEVAHLVEWTWSAG